MILLIEEAKTKECPVMEEKCYASGCMEWRWFADYKLLSPEEINHAGEAGVIPGYCRLGGKPHE